MTTEELKTKILVKQKLIDKHIKQLKELKDKCTHEDFTNESTYSEGGYDYKASTTYFKVCAICGKKFDYSVKEHSWYG